jgi:transcriptional regulator with XRE-family HTH domain
MDHRAEVAEFLRTRRDRLTPGQVGIIGGGRCRVPGLRREEIAMLTGVSVEYYARMERGDLAGVSVEVLDALARALQLDDAECDHLADLAQAADPLPPRRKRPAEQSVKPALQRFLDAVTGVPMWVSATTRDVNRAQIYAWRKGIKTLYYIRIRQMALEGTEVEGRVSCML